MFPQENCNTAALDISVFLPLLTRAALHVQLVEERVEKGLLVVLIDLSQLPADKFQ